MGANGIGGRRLAPTLESGLRHLERRDVEVARAIRSEIARQEQGLVLIASENYASRAVIAAAGTVATNKYAEGYPGRRYYGGCQFVDELEDLAIERAKRLFGAGYANVQLHSGSSANMAAYLSLLNPGDTIMGMALTAGGHLTHGHPVNFSGRIFRSVQYGVDPQTGRIDMNQVRDLAVREKPNLLIAGASAYSRDYDYAEFRAIADAVGAFLVVDIAHPAGLIAAGRLTTPIASAHIVTTTTHKTLRGPRGGMILMGTDFPDPSGSTVGKERRVRQMSEVVNATVMPGLQGGPLMHIIAAKAVAFGEALEEAFEDYADRVIANARALAARMLAAGYHVVSGGTDNHVFLVDLRSRHPQLTGKEAERLLGEVDLYVNANTVPGETRSPFQTSGLRIGTPAVTTRGMGVPEMGMVASLIQSTLSNPTHEGIKEMARVTVAELTARFPIYEETGDSG